MFSIVDMGLLALGALFAGFVAGLAGFGTAMTAMAFWLYVVAPVVAAPLAAICAVGAHAMSVPKIWRDFDLASARIILIGGLVGVPFGIALLLWLSPDLFRGVIGAFLCAYALFMLLLKKPPVISGDGKLGDGVVGSVGGVLGGFAGLSGAAPTIWGQLRGWGKERQRGVIQGFNMLILVFAIAVFAIKGMLTAEVLTAAAICLPATFLGSIVGTRAYLAIDAVMFRRFILGLLFVSGVVLSATWLLG